MFNIEHIEETRLSRLSEVIGIFLIAFSLTTLLSLISYDPLDSAWNVSSTRLEAINWIGSFGAWLADALFQIFGLSAFLIPLMLTTVGWRTLRQRGIRLLHRRFIGLVVVLISIAGLLSLPQMPLYKENIRLGGAIGYLLARFFENFLNKTGTGIVLGVILVLALMMTTSLSINTLLDGAATKSLLQMIVSLELSCRRWWNEQILKFKEWRQHRRALKLRRAEEKAARLQAERMQAEQEKAEERKQAALAEERAKAAIAVVLTQNTEPVPPPEEIVSSKSGRSLKELQKLVYGEQEPEVLLPEISITGFVMKVPERTPQQQERAARQTVDQEAEEIQQQLSVAAVIPERVPVSRRSDTAPVPRINSAPDKRVANNPMLESTSIGKMEDVPEVLSNSAPLAGRVQFSDFELPSSSLLREPPLQQEQDETELWERARLLAEKCMEFSVTGKIQHISPGPVVTTFEFKPDPGVKYSRVTSLTDDLCLALRAESIRIDRIPGKSTVGIEVPNSEREVIYLRQLIESDKYRSQGSPLTIALGKTIDGKPYVADLTKMPHLLIAGATGTGKSVCLNSIIVSILCKASPDEVKMIMVDPKRLELGLYEGIPHLLTPIVLEPKRAANALKWAVGEMENRYKLLAGHGVRNIDQYNQMVRAKHDIIPALHPDEIPRHLPYIVIVIDELADLMMVASNEVETAITRLAQMARAVGIHLIIATQRPSVDVITGLIKANFPSRISFRVSSKVDSRTILDANGAETLLGQGDMLFLPPGTSRLIRVHGAYVGEDEIGRIIDHIKSQRDPSYDDSIQISEEEVGALQGDGEKDELYEEALRIVCQMGRASTSVLQRRLRIGYGRAAAILDMMEHEGYVGPPDGSKPRAVRREAYEFLERLDQMKDDN